MEALELHRTRSRQLALRETPNDEVAILSPDNNHSDSQNTDLSHESQLPPVDKGKDAWLFLASCFFIEALVWGFAFSFGIFQEYYSTHAPFAGSGNIAIIGTTATGIIYISAPLVFALILSFPRLKRWSCPVGLIIMCLSISLSSFATSTQGLIFSQGVGYAIGAGLAYAPTIVFMDEWFVRRKGFAYGVMWAGTGVSGIVLPLLMQFLLRTYGHQTALRTWAIILFIATAPLLYFMKPRLPISQTTRVRSFDLSFLLSRTFLIFQACNTVEALGFFLPQIYLPTYARSLGAGTVTSTLTLVLVNVASMVGCVVMGALTDRYHVTTCITISTVGAVVATLLVWGLSVSLGPLYLFCILYGLFAGSFTSTWPGVIRETQKKKTSADLGMLFGFLAAGRGIGNILSGPLSEALLKGGVWKHANFAYGTTYGPLIVFTGVTACVGGLSLVARPLKLI